MVLIGLDWRGEARRGDGGRTAPTEATIPTKLDRPEGMYELEGLDSPEEVFDASLGSTSGERASLAQQPGGGCRRDGMVLISPGIGDLRSEIRVRVSMKAGPNG